MAIRKCNSPIMQPLTKKQRQVLGFIIYYRQKHNCIPLSSEIDSACFTGNSPSQILLSLERKKYIIRASGKSRSIQIMDIAYKYLNDSDIEMWAERDKIFNNIELEAWRKRYCI
ncbi:MAG: LexA family protein [Candidatus Hodarchaeota archaeon]